MKTTVYGIAVLLAALVFSGNGMASDLDQVCIPIHAKIEAYFTLADCQSPVDLCTAGSITQGGLLNGTTRFTAFALAPQAGLLGSNEPETSLSYRGELQVTTKLGEVVFSDLGVLDQVLGVFSELDRTVNGTGIFSGATGVLFISGITIADGSGFSGSINGEICLAK